MKDLLLFNFFFFKICYAEAFHFTFAMGVAKIMSVVAVNLYDLACAAFLSIDDYRKYEKIQSQREKATHLGEREKKSLSILVSLLHIHLGYRYFANFFYSYFIPHIGKEFDILKIGKDSILNIELKSEDVGESRIVNQLISNHKYLKYLGKKIYCFTFVSSDKCFYKMGNNGKLVIAPAEEVIDLMREMVDEENVDIDSLFRACNYLVSPIIDVEKFLANEYFLTTQQDYIKAQIMKNVSDKYFRIVGEAGTGKTLLMYDIAKSLARCHKVLIISTNYLSKSQNIIQKTVNNLDIKMLNEIAEDKYDYLLVDEAQRLTISQYKFIVGLDSRMIFFLDPTQVLTKEQVKNNVNNQLSKLNPVGYKLSNRIRVNNEVADFTRRLFNLSIDKKYPGYSCVKVIYANDDVQLNKYLLDYLRENYVFISNGSPNAFSKYSINVNDVIGADYERVLMLVDNNFYYQDGRLKSQNRFGVLQDRLLYQGLTRARDAVVLIIYKNKRLFRELIKSL